MPVPLQVQTRVLGRWSRWIRSDLGIAIESRGGFAARFDSRSHGSSRRRQSLEVAFGIARWDASCEMCEACCVNFWRGEDRLADISIGDCFLRQVARYFSFFLKKKWRGEAEKRAELRNSYRVGEGGGYR